MGYIYMLTDTRNGKKYIGQHNGSKKSYWSGGLIPNRIAKVHGKDIFERVILEDNIVNQDLDEREKYYIKTHNTLNEGYNLTEGGEGSNTIGNHPNKEDIVRRISETLKGRVFTDEHKEKLRLNHMSKDPKNREKLSKSMKGIPKSSEHKAKISKTITELNKKLGRWVGDDNPINNPEIRDRISKKNKERGAIRRLKNINGFIEDFKSGKINENNIKKYNKKIWDWSRDLGDDELNKLIPKDVFVEFNKLRNDITTKNIKKRSLNCKGFKHSEETKKKMSKLRLQGDDERRVSFLEYCENLYSHMLDKNLDYLIDGFSKEEYNKIRKKIKRSKFLKDVPDKIRVKLLGIKPIKKKIKPKTDPNKFYGNSNKKVSIDGVVFDSVSDASKKLKINRGTIRYRIKNNTFVGYIYL